MAKCGLCSTKKGKRFCAPLDKVICPVCCAESRVRKIDCNPECRYLEGEAFQKKKEEEKKYARLMGEVGHGQFDDIFQEPAVAEMAYDIESLVLAMYEKSDFQLTDPQVREAYRTIYEIHSERKEVETDQLDTLTRSLFDQYETRRPTWMEGLDETMIGQVYLRLMISINKMSGGRMGNKGYLNYLKNNFDLSVPEGKFVMEDKFGNKSVRDNPHYE
ncbi:MAG: hypothetical protein K9M96_03150 [Deltaproteobacteria bacterium]|nr:hypothetical protein [Deltaproteobacteria bacterium]